MIRSWLGPASVAAAAIVATLPAGDGSFLYDDYHYVVANEAVSGDASIWGTPLGESFQGLWRPVTVATLAAQWDGTGDAGPFLRLNIALHAGVSLLVLLLGRRLGWRPPAALIGAWLFALHPAHAESVAWISGRAEILAAGFTLAAWILHLGRSRSAPWLAAGCVVLGALSKENALVAPALFVFADWALGRRPWPWRRYLGLGGAALLAFAARAAVLEDLTPQDGPYHGLPLNERLVVATNVVGQSLRLLAWPTPLRIHYQRDEFAAARPELLIIVAAAAALAFLAWGRNRRAAAGLILVAVALAPVLHLLPIGEPFAERFLYLPSVAFCLAIGALLEAWMRREATSTRGMGPSLAVTALVLAASLPASRAAVRVFHDEVTLWSHAARIAPDLAVARYNHASALHDRRRLLTEDRDRPGDAEEFAASVAIQPRHAYSAFAHQMLGLRALGAVGSDFPVAATAAYHFREAIDREPGLAAARIHLASLSLTAPGSVGPREALAVLAPLVGDPGLDDGQRLAVQELLLQLSSESSSDGERSTGTSSADGS